MDTWLLKRPLPIADADLNEMLIRFDIFMTRMIDRTPERFMPWLRTMVKALEESDG